MKIEKITIAEIDEIVKLENIIFKDPWPKAFFVEEINNRYTYFFSLKENDRIIGYVGTQIMYEDGDIINIAIVPDYQGQKYGEQLLNHVLFFLKKNNVKFVHLEVRVSNFKAINLYKKVGFKEVRIRKGYYEDKEDCIDMMKGL